MGKLNSVKEKAKTWFKKYAPVGFGGKSLSVGGAFTTGVGLQAGIGATKMAGKAIKNSVPAIKWILMFILACGVCWFNFITSNFSLKLFSYMVFLILFFFFLKGSYDPKKFTRWAIIITILGIFAPTIGNVISKSVLNIYPGLEFFPEFIIILLMIFGYGGPIMMMGFSQHEDNLITTMIQIGVVVFIAFFIISSIPDVAFSELDYYTGTISSQQQQMIEGVLSDVWQFIIGAPEKVVDEVKDRKNESTQFVKQQYHYATTGQSYEETVDENSDIRGLGIDVGEIQLLTGARGQIYQGDMLSSSLTVSSKQLDHEIPINAECYAIRTYQEEDKIPGKINNKEFTLYGQNSKTLTCEFEEDALTKPGSYSIIFEIKFDYITNSYLTRAFVPKTETDKLRNQITNFNPASYYEVPQKYETGKFTTGPINLKVAKEGLVQELKQGINDMTFIYAIGTNRYNDFEGKLDELDFFYISLPEGFMAKRKPDGSFACTYPMKTMSLEECNQLCGENERCKMDCQRYSHYILDKESFKDDDLQRYFGQDTGMACQVETSSTSVLSGNTIPVYKNFRSSLSYTYSIKTSKNLAVVEKEGYETDRDMEKIGQYYTSLITDDSDILLSVKKIKNNAESEINKLSSKSPIIKALVAYHYRTGIESDGRIGPAGITPEIAQYVLGQEISVSEMEENSIEIANKYLDKKLEEDCSSSEKLYIDCAINSYYCPGSSACPQTKYIINLANSYNSESEGTT